MTLENWQDILFACFRSGLHWSLIMVYLVTWIFIGNYVLLNLFLAILLDGFENKEIEDEADILADEIQVAANVEINNESNLTTTIGFSTLQSGSLTDSQRLRDQGGSFHHQKTELESSN